MAKLKSLSDAETASFCDQMSMILKAGLSATEGLSLLLEDSKKDSERVLLSQLYASLLQTGVFSQALRQAGVFPDYMLSMVVLGETTGRLDDTMESLANYYRREAWLGRSIHQAIAYPCVLVVMMLAVILLLITQVMPIFSSVFQQLGTEMTGFAQTLLRFGQFLSAHARTVGVAAVVLVAAGIWLVHSRRASQLAHRLGLARLLSDQIAAYRFANGMSLSLQSGLSPEESLHLTAPLVANTPYQKKVDACLTLVHQGEDLYHSIFNTGVFSGVYARMAALAAHTGTMDEVMEKIADQYETAIDERLARLLAAIEPTLVIVLSVLVGLILLSVMLPLIHLLSAL
jgi:type IV pilus assembly protein PilC